MTTNYCQYLDIIIEESANSVAFKKPNNDFLNYLFLSENTDKNKGNQKVLCLLYEEVTTYGAHNIAHYIGAMHDNEQEVKDFLLIFNVFINNTFKTEYLNIKNYGV